MRSSDPSKLRSSLARMCDHSRYLATYFLPYLALTPLLIEDMTTKVTLDHTDFIVWLHFNLLPYVERLKMQHLNSAHFADGGNQTWAANASSEYPMNYSIASPPKTGSHLVPPHLHGCRVGLVLLHLFLVFVDVIVDAVNGTADRRAVGGVKRRVAVLGQVGAPDVDQMLPTLRTQVLKLGHQKFLSCKSDL